MILYVRRCECIVKDNLMLATPQLTTFQLLLLSNNSSELLKIVTVKCLVQLFLRYHEILVETHVKNIIVNLKC